MRKALKKRWIVGTIVLSLIVGAGGLLMNSNDTSAAGLPEDSSSTTLEQKNHSMGFLFNGVREEIIAFLKLDEAEFLEKLKDGETLANIAEDQGITREDLIAELTKEVNTELDQAKTNFTENIDSIIDSTNTRMFGFRGHGHGGKHHGGYKIDLTETAKLLNFETTAELKTALTSGTSIADLATERGIDIASVIDLLVSQIEEALDADLAAQKITQEQYDAKKANITAVVTAKINNKHDGFGKRGGFGGKGHHHKFGEDTAPTPTTETPTT